MSTWFLFKGRWHESSSSIVGKITPGPLALAKFALSSLERGQLVSLLYLHGWPFSLGEMQRSVRALEDLLSLMT